MKYWLDTEFIEDGKTIDLISIGIVAEDGREYYAISTEFKRRKASPWVRENVLAYLPDRNANPITGGYSPRECQEALAYKSRKQIAAEIVTFVRDAPEFWGYFADYDWVVLCQLYGTMMDLPAGWPMYCRDLKQWADQQGSPPLPPPPEHEHHALVDARWNRSVWQHLEARERKL